MAVLISTQHLCLGELLPGRVPQRGVPTALAGDGAGAALGAGTATCAGCPANGATPGQPSAFCWLSRREFSVVCVSMGRCPGWHVPPELVAELSLFCLQHWHLSCFQQRCSSRMRCCLRNPAVPALPAQPHLQPFLGPDKVISATQMVKPLALMSHLGGN